MADITPAELHQRQQAGETPTIIDVRETWEHEETRIPGAQNIPLNSLPDKLEDIDEWKNQEIIVHCKGGGRSASAKAYASDVAMSVTTDAVQVFGGYGYTRDFPVERMMRDAKITQIYEGTNQINRMVIARQLLK